MDAWRQVGRQVGMRMCVFRCVCIYIDISIHVYLCNSFVGLLCVCIHTYALGLACTR